MRIEDWNITGTESGLLRRDQWRKVGSILDLDPETVEETVAVERVSEDVWMVALVEKHSVAARRSQHDAHLVIRESGDRPLLRQELIAIVEDRAIDRCKARNHRLHEHVGLYFASIKSRTVLTAGNRKPLPHDAHLIGSHAFESRNLKRRKLARGAADSAQIDAFGFGA